MTTHVSKRKLEWIKNIVRFQLFSKSELRDGNRTFLEPKLFSSFSSI